MQDVQPISDAAPKAPSQWLRKAALLMSIIVLGGALPFIRTGNDASHQLLMIFGFALIVIGVFGRCWCTMYIGGQKFKDVVQTGPYSLSRNPLYMFSFFATFGAGLQSGSIIYAMAALIIVWLVFTMTIRNEEAKLAQKFGTPYAEYCARVPRFGPKISNWHDEQQLTVIMPLVYRTLADGLIFFAIIPAALLIDWLQRAGHLPVLLRLPF